MACGTGKTLTALWIAERLQSSLTLVLVPSLSLVQQNLAEWGRHSTQDFDTLVVCSDESVLQRNEDTALQSTVDLGVKVTTKPAEIQQFLDQHRKRPAVVFATYQSSDRIATAQAGATSKFDLAICDEAHRLAGHAEGLFATVLDSKKIKASKRLFMTATPRYFKEHVKRRAAELEFELVSMDDAHVFGPEFHVLTFHEAISAKPEPLLTDYQVVVIGVTDREAKAWAERATLVRIPARRGSPDPAETPDRRSPLHAAQDSQTQSGDLRSKRRAGSGDPRTAQSFTTDARTLAAQIGLAKAMQKYDLRKLITFHSSVAKAARFVDATRRDSLPGVIAHMTSFVVPPLGGKKRRPPPNRPDAEHIIILPFKRDIDQGISSQLFQRARFRPVFLHIFPTSFLKRRLIRICDKSDKMQKCNAKYPRVQTCDLCYRFPDGNDYKNAASDPKNPTPRSRR